MPEQLHFFGMKIPAVNPGLAGCEQTSPEPGWGPGSANTGAQLSIAQGLFMYMENFRSWSWSFPLKLVFQVEDFSFEG